MEMQIDADEILDKASGADDRKKISLYLSDDIYRRFQRVCKRRKAPASKVLELLIGAFLDGAEREGSKR